MGRARTRGKVDEGRLMEQMAFVMGLAGWLEFCSLPSLYSTVPYTYVYTGAFLQVRISAHLHHSIRKALVRSWVTSTQPNPWVSP